MLIFFIAGFLLIGSACLAQTANTPMNKDVFLPNNIVISDIYFTAGQNVNLNAQMKDDVYVAGVNVEISGPVDGDVIVAGSNVVINSEIKGNLRVVGGTILINGKIAKNVTVAGGMVTISESAEIGQNLIIGAGNAQIKGKINKNLYGGAGNLTIDSEVLGSAYLKIDPEGSLILYPSANIHGNLEYTATKTADIMAGAQIQNEEKFSQWPQAPKSVEPKSKFTIWFLTWWLAGLFGTLVVGLVVIFIFKNQTLKVEKKMSGNIFMSILKGLVYLIVTPLALILLGITMIGLPLALILGALYLILLYLAIIFVAIFIGEKILRLFFKHQEIPLIWPMIVGTLAIFILIALPLVGWLIKLIAILWGLGVLMTIIKSELKLENT
ncbi:MAG: polymer-forming cytoskeletal protein [Patescibacteria group bacterium]